MTKLARFISPNNAGLTEVKHDGTLLGKGTSESRLRVIAGNAVIHDSSLFGDGSASDPLTAIATEFIILTEDGFGIATEDSQYLLTEDYV